MTYPLAHPMTTDKAVNIKETGLRHLGTSLPGHLSDWTLIGFDVSPTDDDLTAYPIVVDATVQHSEFEVLGEVEQLIEDSEDIVEWLASLGIDLNEVQIDLNANRYDDIIGDFAAYSDPHDHDFDYEDDL